MEMIVKKSDLLREVAATIGATERKTTIPILANLLFEADKFLLSITGTDLGISMRTSCEAKVAKSGKCAVPARKFYDYIKLLPEGDVTIKVLENHWIQVRSGRSSTKMVGMAAANYPALSPFPASSVAVGVPLLKHLIARTMFAISKEESRYTLSGALLVIKPESVAMVATDGHRLAYIEKSEEQLGCDKERHLLIPLRGLSELMGLLQGVESLDLGEDEASIFFRVGSRLLTCRKLTGQFPAYQAVMPESLPTHVTLDREATMTALQRVAQFSDERSGAVRVSLGAGELTLAAESAESGSAEEPLSVEYAGNPLTVGFNHLYLLDFLKAAGVDAVTMGLKDSGSAMEMRPVEDTGFVYRYVVMPMRV